MRVYLDLDGVMADFDKHFKDKFGVCPQTLDDNVLWKKINSYPEFYENLPLMPGAIELFEFLTDSFDVTILTACPKSNYYKSALQKKAWVREYLCDKIVILPVMGGKNKGLFMYEKGDLLIDDMEKNCLAWNELGGISIQHRDSNTTIQVVRSLL